MINILLTLVFMVTVEMPAVHDIHVSVANIYMGDDGIPELETKIFFDDLQMGVGLKPGSELPSTYSSSDDLIDQFVNNHLIILFDGQPATLKYQESYLADQAVWSIFKIKSMIKFPERMQIENSILVDLYDDQVNILNINFGSTNTTVSFDRKKQKKEIYVKK